MCWIYVYASTCGVCINRLFSWCVSLQKCLTSCLRLRRKNGLKFRLKILLNFTIGVSGITLEQYSILSVLFLTFLPITIICSYSYQNVLWIMFWMTLSFRNPLECSYYSFSFMFYVVCKLIFSPCSPMQSDFPFHSITFLKSY